MRILIAGFKGTKNTSKILLDNIESEDKVYLENDKRKSCEQIFSTLQNNSYDYVFLLGQKPIFKNKVSIELQAHSGAEIIKTNFDIEKLKDNLQKSNIACYLSESCGTSFCNHIYFYTLSFFKQNARKEKCIFLHLPTLNNFKNLNGFAEFLNKLLS